MRRETASCGFRDASGILNVEDPLGVLSRCNQAISQLEIEGHPNVVLIERTPFPRHHVVVEPTSRLPSKDAHSVNLLVTATASEKLARMSPYQEAFCSVSRTSSHTNAHEEHFSPQSCFWGREIPAPTRATASANGPLRMMRRMVSA